MNLRDIKKDIDYVIGAFVDDCTMFLEYHPGLEAGEVGTLIDEAVDLYNMLREKAAAPAEGGKRAHFDALRKELLEKTDALYDRLSVAVKKSLGE